MKKTKNKKHQEIVSLNDELLSFDMSDMGLEVLERRLELVAVTNRFNCNTFSCGSFSNCDAFSCGAFAT